MRDILSRVKRGFTLIELLVVITIIGILAAIALPNYIRAKDKAKEVQTKSSTKAIQVATERYHTDFEEYPLFLLGGDVEGWANWHAKYDEPNPDLAIPQNAWVQDVLIMGAYIEAYPENAFTDNGNAVIAQTGPVNPPANGYEPGMGDPRFGMRGTNMANGLENPMIFLNWFGDVAQNIETYRTLTTSTEGDPAMKGFGTPSVNTGFGSYPYSGTQPQGIHYSFAGRIAPLEAQAQGTYTIFTHWPGNFFYRGFGDRWIDRKGWTVYRPQAFVGADTARYIMGCYGSYSTEGIDVIRGEQYNSSGQQMYYRLPPPWGESGGGGIAALVYGSGGSIYDGGMPEVVGGGDDTLGPWLPPDRSVGFPAAFIYGSPDGHKDGVILVLQAGEEVQAY